MPADKTWATFLAVEAGFVATGTMMLIFALNTQASVARPFTIDNVARDILLQECPVRGKYTLPKLSLQPVKSICLFCM